MSTPASPVSKADEPWQIRLQEAWRTLEKQQQVDTSQLKSQYEAGKSEAVLAYDVRRAELLAQYHAEGVSQRDIALCIEVSKSQVNRLLRYHRYLSMSPTGDIIPEGRFRDYWRQMANVKRFTGRLPKDADERAEALRQREALCQQEEQRVFAQIVEWVQAGKPPMPRPKEVKPKTPEQLAAPKGWKQKIRREVNRIYRVDIQPEVKALSALLRADRSQWAPTMIAGRAQRLERGMDNLLKSLREHQLIEDNEEADQA
jgi:hypothetical protein